MASLPDADCISRLEQDLLAVIELAELFPKHIRYSRASLTSIILVRRRSHGAH